MTESDRLEATYYAILGAQPGASGDELRRAYIAKVKTSHPDLFRFDTALRAKAEERMKQINEAYEHLKRFGDRPASEETEEEDDETVGDDVPEDEQDDEEDEEDEDEFESDDWDDFERWARCHQDHASDRDQTGRDSKEGPPIESELQHEPHGGPAGPRWAAMVAAMSVCYGAIRVAAALSVWIFPLILAAVWTFALIQGLRNNVMVYANIKDVVLSLLTGTVMVVGHLNGNIYTTLIGLLLCLISAVWSSRCNGNILTGMAVCVFKITFSPCWVAAMMVPWFLSDDQRTAIKFRLLAFRTFMMLLMSKLVNGDRR